MFQTRGLREFFLRYCYESGKAERMEIHVYKYPWSKNILINFESDF